MKKLMEVALGVVTGIGGFLEAGSLLTAAQAGADFRYQLLWAVAVGTFALVVLMEMSGRLAIASKCTLADALRERFGIQYFTIPLVVGLVLSMMVLAAEVGGVTLAVEMATGVGHQWWAVPVALVGWMALWKGKFGPLEKGTAMLGLVSVVIGVAAVKLHPAWGDVGKGLVPTAPTDQRAHYWFLAVGIVGAAISPYLAYFYSSGAIEEHWTVEYLGINKITASLGNILGGALSGALLVVAGVVFQPRGIHVDQFQQVGLLLTPALGRWGFVLFVATIGVNCFGATVEIALSCAYLLAQALGWEWKEDAKPREHARFSLAYSAAIVLATVPIALGVDVVKLTNFSMALTAASLPVTVLPMLVLMNDSAWLSKYRNGWLANAMLGVVAVMSLVLFVVAIPLQFLGGG
jgi:Mn2+/Fe2+ NRAMP family transporter